MYRQQHLEMIDAELTSVSAAPPAMHASGTIMLRALPRTMTLLIPCLNEADNLTALIPALYAQTRALCGQLNILIVDDGSTDQTVQVCHALSGTYPVECLQLSRNFGKENAITAGLDHCDADVVVIIDGDGQHPGDVVATFIDNWRHHYDMVYGVRADRQEQPVWKRHCSKLFYSLLSKQANIVPDAGDFRLLDRKVVDALRQLPENNRFMKGLYAWVGFRSIGVPFEVKARQSGNSRFRPGQLLGLAITGITAFSNAPLRIWSGLGLLVSLSAVAYGAFTALHTMIYGNSVPGWTTLSVGMMFIGGVQLFSIGVLGEYIGRIFSEVKQRPTYIVAQHHRPARAPRKL